MGRPILVRGARQLLTLRGPIGPRRGKDLRNLGMVPDGSVLIADGVIQEVGPTRRVENLAAARDAVEVSAAGRVVMPGFVDSYTHLVSGAPRLAEFEAMISGEHTDLRAGATNEIESTPAKTLERQAARIIEDCVREGTTTIEAKSGFGGSEAGEMKILRVCTALDERPIPVVSTAMVPAAFQGGAPRQYLERLLKLIRRRHLAEFIEVEWEDNVRSYEECRELLCAARRAGLGVKVQGEQRSRGRAVELAIETGATSIGHLLHANDMQAAMLGRSAVVATLLPGTVFFLGSERYEPAKRLIEAGAAVALATNYNSRTCPTHNMQMVVTLACRAMQMTPAEAIAAATINGAHALGRGDRTGSIEYGKDADLLVLSAPDYRELPYHFGVNLVEMTMRRGEIIYSRAEVTWPDR